MLEFTTYHKLLRVSSLTFAVVLSFQSGLFSGVTAELAQNTQQYLASAVGIYAGVAPTDLNQITAGLTERELALATREDAIAAREIDIGLQPGGISQSTTTFMLATVLFILLVLILLNYALDYIRARERAQQARENTAAVSL